MCAERPESLHKAISNKSDSIADWRVWIEGFECLTLGHPQWLSLNPVSFHACQDSKKNKDSNEFEHIETSDRDQTVRKNFSFINLNKCL